MVQTAFAARALAEQLQRLGLLPDGASVGTEPELDRAFRGAWTDNADALAQAYGCATARPWSSARRRQPIGCRVDRTTG